MAVQDEKKKSKYAINRENGWLKIPESEKSSVESLSKLPDETNPEFS